MSYAGIHYFRPRRCLEGQRQLEIKLTRVVMRSSAIPDHLKNPIICKCVRCKIKATKEGK